MEVHGRNALTIMITIATIQEIAQMIDVEELKIQRLERFVAKQTMIALQVHV